MRSRHSFLLSSLLIFALVAFAAGCSQSAEGDEGSSGWSLFRSETVVLPAGTALKVRLTTGLSSAKNSGGDTFEGTLENEVVVGDKVIFARGTDVEGKVTHAVESGRLKKRADIKTSTAGRKEGSKAKRDILIIGGGSGAGALIGGLTGGGKGAAIGAGVGAGGGTAAAALTGKRDIVFPPETLLRFVLKEDTKVEL